MIFFRAHFDGFPIYFHGFPLFGERPQKRLKSATTKIKIYWSIMMFEYFPMTKMDD